MRAATELRTRAQVAEKSAGLEAATRDAEGALTVEGCAMYVQQIGILRQINALAVKAINAEESHLRRAMGAELNRMRDLAGVLIERIYRVACDSPRSRFGHVRDAAAALRVEAEAALWPKS